MLMYYYSWWHVHAVVLSILFTSVRGQTEDDAGLQFGEMKHYAGNPCVEKCDNETRKLRYDIRNKYKKTVPVMHTTTWA